MDRYEQAHYLLKTLKSCAIKAGIYENMFISFGTLLGAIRPTIRYHHKPEPYWARGVMSHDKDMDLGILKDRCEPQQLEKYFSYCCRERLMSHWGNINDRQQRRRDDGSLLWFSVKNAKDQIKCCNWMFFEFNGWSYHSKGKRWLSPRKMQYVDIKIKRKSQALGKGIPAKFVRELIEIDFEGLKFNAPRMSGTLLDMWYPGWHEPRKGGASKKESVLVVGEWGDPDTWRIM